VLLQRGERVMVMYESRGAGREVSKRPTSDGGKSRTRSSIGIFIGICGSYAKRAGWVVGGRLHALLGAHVTMALVLVIL
jgi:hypothetical protein